MEPAQKALAQAMGRELRGLVQPLTLHVAASEALGLATLIQMARQHPLIADQLDEAGVGVLNLVFEYFKDCPCVLAVLCQGEAVRYHFDTGGVDASAATGGCR